MRKPLHGQKKKDLTLTLTPDGVEKLEAKAKALGLSKSELIEQIARDQVSSPLEQQLLGECSTT
ncbi:ribbon-helix-helix domain-containing protein [Nostoc sp. CCY 9925]|uniref:ribbon-helix-helix domain-containing protein n=1 Tax=Nostoc sp. CCY 9925 TaxID=3103865 RepID=UPI0039C6DFCB